MKMKIYLPHINYTVHFYSGKDVLRIFDDQEGKAWTAKGEKESIISVRKEKDAMAGVIAHEIIHVLQNIADDRGMDFVSETEHFGYLMQYILGKILGYEWK